MTQLYNILKASKLGAGAAPDMYTALLAQKISKGGSGGEAELSGVPPLTFTADGTPLLDYLITGNTVQNGTPTPDNPIMPQGTGERTANLAQWEKGGISISTGENEAYRTKEQGGTCEQLRTQYISCIGGSDYVLSVNKHPVQSFISFYDENKNYLTRTTVTSQSSTRTFKADIDAKYMRAQISHVTQDQVYPAIEENAQFAITLDSTHLPHEPYGYKIPISSASMTTPIYLGEVQTTRKIKKLVLTGEEINEGAGNAPYWFYLPEDGANINLTSTWWICSHYQPVSNSATWSNYNSLISFSTVGDIESNKLKKLRIRDTACVTLSDFKSYLAAQYAAGTPVTVWYVLAEPETAVVNEPLMKIGDYADTVSKAQAGATIPTNNGSTTVDVGTTVKPSEVYIKYYTK